MENPQDAQLERGLTPSPLVLRSAEEGMISIVNTNKEGENQRDLKVIRENTLLKEF